MAQAVKKLPAMQETQIWSLGWEDSLEKGMATHSSILAWKIPWAEETGGYSPWGGKELDMNEQLTLSLSMLSKKEKQFSPFPNLREKAFSVSLPSMMLVV